jgi:hypothetical protein
MMISATSVLHTAQRHLPQDLIEQATPGQAHLHTASSSTLMHLLM